MRKLRASFIGLFIIIGLISISSCKSITVETDCNGIIISPVADQQLFENTRAYIPLSSVLNQLDKIKYSVTNAPSFVKLRTTQRGRSELTLDPTSENVGMHTVTIEATDGQRKGCINFTIEVKSVDKSMRVIHCDPKQQKNGSGKTEDPYGSFSKLLSSGFNIEPHDLIILHTGNHGSITLTGADYVIASANESTPIISDLSINNANHISVRGIEIKPKSSISINLHNEYLVYIDSTSNNIDFSNNKVISTSNSERWTVENWNTQAARGIKSLASHVEINSNLIQNVFHGIKTEGDNIKVFYNHVDRFGGDAIRNTGSNNTYNYNFLTNATIDDYYDKGGNHDDLFQSWTFDKPIDKIQLNHNIMISCLDTLIPLRAKIVQGLVCFDGFETNWIVQNNLIVTDHPHGIALYGADNCTISNNTVLKNPHNLYQYESDPWIMINNHKDGRKSKNNIVKNNTTSALNIVSDDVETKENIVIDSLQKQNLNNYNDWDFRFKK